MTKEEVLKAVAEYCASGEADVDTLNKICETASLTAQRSKGRLSTTQSNILNKALDGWISGKATPIEFKNAFRGA